MVCVYGVCGIYDHVVCVVWVCGMYEHVVCMHGVYVMHVYVCSVMYVVWCVCDVVCVIVVCYI